MTPPVIEWIKNDCQKYKWFTDGSKFHDFQYFYLLEGLLPTDWSDEE